MEENKTTQKEKQLPKQNSAPQSCNQSQSLKKVTVVIGDSIIKKNQGWHL